MQNYDFMWANFGQNRQNRGYFFRQAKKLVKTPREVSAPASTVREKTISENLIKGAHRLISPYEFSPNFFKAKGAIMAP